MYLTDEKQRVALAEFLAGGLWAAVEHALQQRRPSYSDATDCAETAAHRSFIRKGHELCQDDIRKLAVETPPVEDGIIPATLADPRD